MGRETYRRNPPEVLSPRLIHKCFVASTGNYPLARWHFADSGACALWRSCNVHLSISEKSQTFGGFGCNAAEGIGLSNETNKGSAVSDVVSFSTKNFWDAFSIRDIMSSTSRRSSGFRRRNRLDLCRHCFTLGSNFRSCLRRGSEARAGDCRSVC